MNATGLFPFDRRTQRRRCHLVFLGDQRELGAPGIEFRCIALIHVDVCRACAKDGLPGLGQGRQGKHIGRRSGCNEIDCGLGRLKDITDTGGDLGHFIIGAIAHRVATVGSAKGGQDFGAGRAGVV